MATTIPIHVLVLHEDPLTRAGVTAALTGRDGIVVRVRDDIELIRDTEVGFVQSSVDVVIADYRTGIEFARRSQRDIGRSAARSPRVMIVTRCERELEIRTALKSGIHGYLHHGCPLDELVEGVRILHRGGRHLGAGAARLIADSLTHEALTCREAEVLHWVAKGHPNKAIANQLDVAVGTIKTHVKAILGKLGARSRTEAAAMAAQRGLLEAEPGTEQGTGDSVTHAIQGLRPHPSGHNRAALGLSAGLAH